MASTTKKKGNSSGTTRHQKSKKETLTSGNHVTSTELVPTKLSDEVRNELTDSRSPYSAEDKIKIAMAYIIANGNSRKAAELVDIDIEPNTLRQWKLRRAWWPTAIEQARAILQQDLDHAYTSIVHKTEREILNRLEKGDIYVHSGSVQRVPIDAKTLTYIHGIIADKRNQLRGNALRAPGGGSQLEVLYKIMGLLKDMTDQQPKEVIAGEWDNIPDDALS